MEPIWSRISERIRQVLPPEEWKAWFEPLRPQAEGPKELILAAPDHNFVETLERQYRKLLDETAAAVRDETFQILLTADPLPAAADTQAPLEVPSLPLNPKYRFETFVVGNSNQFAHAAARAVAESPSHSYNPLFLYGSVGLGKTHLLHAMAHRLSERFPHLRIAYLTAEQFVNHLIAALRLKTMPHFRDRFRSIDVLLVDDIQFLANKERTQEEFFHTFNDLYSHQRQIVLSSDSPPRSIPAIEERLRSRFEWGLLADIQPPDLETKIAILKSKAELSGVSLPDEVAIVLARHLQGNVRELEGALNRLLAVASLTGTALSPELARESLRGIIPTAGSTASAAEIIKCVARHYGLKVSEIKSRSNAKQIAFPRQVAMYLCKQLTNLSYPEIGRLFHDKHHSTVMYSVEKIANLRQQDPELARVLDSLIRSLS
jgi:chromosomal replication initiator protein